MSPVQPPESVILLAQSEAESSIPSRFESIVRRYSTRLAVKIQEHSYTYDMLNGVANQVAHAILALQGAEAEPVALLLDGSVSAIASMLGVLKARKFYVPLNPSFPRAHLTALLEEVQPRLIITDNQHLALAKALTSHEHHVLNMDTLAASLATENPGLALSPDMLAEIMYTSGSTGRPKGVVQTHRTILHNWLRQTNCLSIGAEDRLTLLASFSTGQAKANIYRALLNGAALYPRHIKEEGLTHLAAWLAEEEITLYHSSATLFRAFIDTLTGTETFPKLRVVRAGSEVVTTQDVALYQAHMPPTCLLLNSLGSTETGTIRAYLMHRETPINGGRVPVGYAVDGMEILLLDEHGAEVGFNQPGEIVVRSRYLSPGYWRRPDLTAAAFQPDSRGGDAHLYRTGDLGCMLPDGCLIHLGRNDFRVKIRGHRIELAEVERVLHRHMAIKDAVVMARPSRTGEHHLVAYVVPTEQPGPSIRALRGFVQQKLPDYMVPTAFELLPALPLTPSGKVDRQRLRSPDGIGPASEHAHVAPRTPVETELVRLWSEVLGGTPVGIHNAFVALGGDSLVAMRLAARVQQAFQVDVPLRSLLEASSVATMAVVVTQQLARQLTNAELARLLAEMEGSSSSVDGSEPAAGDGAR